MPLIQRCKWWKYELKSVFKMLLLVTASKILLKMWFLCRFPTLREVEIPYIEGRESRNHYFGNILETVSTRNNSKPDLSSHFHPLTGRNGSISRTNFMSISAIAWFYTFVYMWNVCKCDLCTRCKISNINCIVCIIQQIFIQYSANNNGYMKR